MGIPEDTLRYLFNNMMDAFAGVGLDGRIVTCNDLFCDMVGYSRQELLSMTYQDLTPEKWHRFEADILRDQVLPRGYSDVYQKEYRHRNGTVFPVELRVCLHRDPMGVPDCMWAIVRDISERKCMEEALRASEERYRAVLEDQTEVISRFLADGTLTFVNDVYCRFFGRSREDLLGKKWQPHALAEDVKAIEGKLAGLSPDNPVVVVENRVYSSRGHVHWMQFSNRGFFDTAGILLEIQSVGRDITELKRAEEERLELERRLQRAIRMESIGVLAGGIAHDFNNLLSVILGNLDLAMMGLPPESPIRERLIQAAEVGERAAHLIRQMLAYAGKRMMMMETTDLNRIIGENEERLRDAVSGSAVLALRPAKSLPPIQGDREQLLQVVMDLMSNAAEAMDGPPGIITLSTGEVACDQGMLELSRVEEKPAPGRFVYLEVADNGCGMDEETQQRLFEPFFSTKFLGRGLGMSAVMGIVRAHGGTILLTSAPGRGTTIRVLLPVLTSASSPPEAAPG